MSDSYSEYDILQDMALCRNIGYNIITITTIMWALFALGCYIQMYLTGYRQLLYNFGTSIIFTIYILVHSQSSLCRGYQWQYTVHIPIYTYVHRTTILAYIVYMVVTYKKLK